jgi:hypothetical protein
VRTPCHHTSRNSAPSGSCGRHVALVTLRCLLTALAVATSGSPTAAQSATGPAAGGTGSPHDAVAVGVTLTPALEGGGPWLLSAARVSVPLGKRTGLDLDAGRIFGATNASGSIRRFYAAQIRFLRAPRDAKGASRYWLAGLTDMRGTKSDGHGHVTVPHKSWSAFTIGYGLDQFFRNGSRVATEIGLSAGDGLLAYGSVVVQWGPRR